MVKRTAIFGKRGSEPKAAGPDYLRNVLIGILGLQAVALGFKALDDRRVSDNDARQSQELTTRLVHQAVERQVSIARNAMELASRSGASREIVADSVPDLEQIYRLADAARSNDARLEAAAQTASRLIATKKSYGLSSTGDMVVVVDMPGSNALFGLAPAVDWLPLPSANQKTTLIGETEVSLGNLQVLRGSSINEDGGQIAIEGNARLAKACYSSDAGDVTVCTAKPLPWITNGDLVRLAFYMLLLLGPALAIYGLSRDNLRQARERRIAEDERVNAEHLIDLVMSASKAGYWEWDEQSDLIFVSLQFSDLFEAGGKSEISGHDLLDMIHTDDRESVRRAVIDSRASGHIHGSFRTSRNSSPRWMEMRGQRLKDAATNETRFVGIVMDVTERKLAELRLKTTELRLRNAIEGFKGPFALWDKRRRLVVWNEAFSRDFKLKDIVREAISYDAVAVAKQQAVQFERESRDEARARELRLRDGRWIKLIERPTSDGGLMTIGFDITGTVETQESLTSQKERMRRAVLKIEQQEARAAELAKKYQEEKLRAEQASQSKSAFLANVSHELRTPLNAINGFSEMLVQEIFGPLGDSRYNEYAADILASGRHLLEMINDILDMSKIEAGKMTINKRSIDPVDPVDAAVRMVRHRADEAGITLVLEHDDPPFIDADHRAIRQMVLNLLSNAIKFTDSGGKILVTVGQREGFVRIAVRDSGIGIPKEALPRLARPFEQVQETIDRNYEGTGLGLALTKSFAEMHGGKMSIASEVGKGTLVAVYLPLSSAEKKPEPKASGDSVDDIASSQPTGRA